MAHAVVPAVPALPGTELVLVRHGQGVCNAAGVIGGQSACRGLSPLGRRQSARLADRLADLHARRPFDVLVASPRPRVVECAQIIGARLAMPVDVVDDLRGQDFGAADGQPWDQVIQGFGGPPAHDPDRPLAAGAEAWSVYAARVLAGLTALLAAHDGRRILLVGHGRTTGLAGALLSGAADPRSRTSDFVVGHGEFVAWRREAGGWRLVLPS